MLHAAIQVVLYGLLAGLSVLGFAATLAVMPSGRLKAFGFGAGFVGAQILTCSVLVIFGIVATGSSGKSYPGLRGALEVALALVLIALALVVHRRPPNTNDGPTAHERSKARTQALLERLSRLRVLTTIVAGFLLGIGGPKRLVLTCLAATTIVSAGLGDAEEAALVVVYVTLATALVWGPLILFLLLGKRVIALMEGAQGRVGRRQPQVTVYSLLILAGLLFLDAGSSLLT
jgi:Na+/melibiose symporter-like transporter